MSTQDRKSDCVPTHYVPTQVPKASTLQFVLFWNQFVDPGYLTIKVVSGNSSGSCGDKENSLPSIVSDLLVSCAGFSFIQRGCILVLQISSSSFGFDLA